LKIGIERLVGRADHQDKKTSGEGTAGSINTDAVEVALLNEEPSGVV